MAAVKSFLLMLVFCGGLVTAQTDNKKSHLIVTTILDKPFVFKSEDSGKLIGFVVDILDKVMEKIGCTYELKEVKDAMYGSPMDAGAPNTTWNGMIGEVKRGEADLAAAALTMTSLRKAHVDYSYPFFTSGLAVLMRKDDVYGKASEGIFGLSYFLTPFSVGVWLLIAVAYLTVSLGFILINIFNPYEWRQRVQRGEIKDQEETDDHFGVKESLWFTFTTLLWQGFSKRPLSIAARILGAFWMFFCLLVVGSYIALMVRNPNLVFNVSPGRMLNITGISSFRGKGAPPISCIAGGSTQWYIMNHKSPFFIKIFENMKRTGFVKTTQEGVERARNEGVAFVMESGYLSYITARDCSLVQIGDEFAERHYAFAMQKNDDLRHRIDQALLQMSETGELHRLRYIWWYFKDVETRCRGNKLVGPSSRGTGMGKTQRDNIVKSDGLELQAFGGPLIFLLIGMILAAVVCIVEIFIFKYYDQKPGVPFSGDKDAERA